MLIQHHIKSQDTAKWFKELSLLECKNVAVFFIQHSPVNSNEIMTKKSPFTSELRNIYCSGYWRETVLQIDLWDILFLQVMKIA